jgi:Ni/Co efflux regulator RcnB
MRRKELFMKSSRKFSMKYRALMTGLVIASMGLAGVAQANPGNGNSGHGNPGNGNSIQGNPGNGQGHGNAHGNGQGNPGQAGHQGQENHRDWHEGGHVPDRYRDDSHWVRNWHDRDLPEPPRGHRWLEIDGDYVLAAVATGVITSIILGH